ncbi:MAG: hypothetical protein ABTQ31_01615 [Rhizobiaceae bacterium]
MTQTQDQSSFERRAQAEVLDLHRVLQAWFRGEGDMNPDLVLSHFDGRFRMVGAAGTVAGRADLAAGLPKMWGSRPSLVMEIGDLAVPRVEGTVAIVVYRETQRQNAEVNHRWASAALLDRGADATPAWLTLQETWCATPPA